MNSSWARIFLAAAACTPVAFAQTLCVQVYNFAHVRPAILNDGLAETGRLFKPAGIRIDWQSELVRPDNWRFDMSSRKVEDTDRRPCLLISILGDFPDTLLAGALGFALPFAHTGPHAIIFYNRVEMAARAESTAEYIALGHAIAHELGHDLLRSAEHSRAGLMQARLNKQSWQLAKQGLLAFLPQERETIRRTALQISAHLATDSARRLPMDDRSAEIVDQH